MAVALVQTAKYTGTASQTNMTFTLGSTPTVGNLLLFIPCYYTGDDPVLTPSGWTLQGTNYEPNQAGVSVFTRIVQSGDGTSWNLNVMSSADQNSGFLLEVSGQASTSFINKQGNSTAAGTPSSLASASVTPSVLNCLAIAAFLNTGSGGTDAATFSAGWTKEQAAESTFQPAWLASRNALTSDTTTAISTTISSMNGGGLDASSVILLIAPGSSAVNATVAQVHATLTFTGGTQSIATVQDVATSQSAATLTFTGGTQSVATVQNSAVSQSGATLTLTGGTQAVAAHISTSAAQSAASLTFTGGTQSIASVQDVSIAQSAATLTLTGGTQAVTAVQVASTSQSAATITFTGGTQAVAAGSIISSSVSQVGATLTLTGGTQTLATVQDVSISQTYASLTFTGGTQSVTGSIPKNTGNMFAVL
jgi:hypothetical protein